MTAARLSKSQYIRGLQCHKALWLYRHRRDLMAEPDANRLAIFATGDEVGALAQQLFPGGVEIEFDYANIDAMCAQTARLIEEGAEVIYEATFASGDLLVMADILVRNGARWDFYEVKSSTKLKAYHLDDAAFQWRVVAESLPLGRAHVVHIDNGYRLDGELDLQGLFAVVDVTERVVERQAELESRLQAMQAMLPGRQPDIAIGPHCSQPFDCDFEACCWQSVPRPSVFDLYRMPLERKFELFQQGQVYYRDLVHQALNPTQALQVETALRDEIHVDAARLAGFLDAVEFPLHFLDFETLQQAVPKIQGLKPYLQIPFQYSLHILHGDGSLQHREHLANGDGDPRAPLAARLLEDIGPRGSIVAYSQSTEIGAIRSLAATCTEQSAKLEALTTRFVDLLTPFRELMYYHPGFHGSFSIKSVLPAMFADDAEASYQHLDIQDGRMAMNEYARLARLEDPAEGEQLRAALLAYCRLDTLAMVKIWLALDESRIDAN